MPSPPNIDISYPQPGLVVVTLPTANQGVVLLDSSLLDQMDSCLQQLADDQSHRGLILRSAGRVQFAKPLDTQFIANHPQLSDAEITNYCQRGRSVLSRLRRCPFPTLALIEQDCLDSALETALWCDYRLVSDTDILLGMPAVASGWVPCWAGTVSLPRTIGLSSAARLLTGGDTFGPVQAQDLELVDEVQPHQRCLDAACELLQRVSTSQAFVQLRQVIAGPVPGITPSTWQEVAEPVMDQTGERIVANRRVYPLAPTVILEHLIRTCVMPAKDAWRSESEAVCQVWNSASSRGLLYYRQAVERNIVSPGLVDLTLPAKKIQNLGIVGAGLMGRSIAQIAVDAGLEVWLLDANQAIAKKAVQEINRHSPPDKGPSNTSDQPPGKAHWTIDYDVFADCDLVIESVVETADVKKIVLQQIEASVGPKVLMATNTSAIPIEKLGGFLKHPERFCGIHFCHPELMQLVEIICGPDTAESTITSAVRFVQAIDKMPVAMNDGPGFVVNRLLASLIDGSLELFVAGVSISDIDAAIRQFGFLGGPFQIIDVIGVDTCMYAGRTMWESGLECVSLSPILPKLMKNDRLGQKVGRGFYDYPQPDSNGIKSEETSELLQGYREDGLLELDADTISSHILGKVAAEAQKIVAEDLVRDEWDVDLCIVNGFSFPKHWGGILFWQRQTGA